MLRAACRHHPPPQPSISMAVPALPSQKLEQSSSQARHSPPLWSPGRQNLATPHGTHICCPRLHSALPRPWPLAGPCSPAPRLLAERQELILLWVRPAPHLIAPVARRKINSTFYTSAASVLKFWHICQLKKKKVIKPRKCHLIVLAELIWRLRCSSMISPSIWAEPALGQCAAHLAMLPLLLTATLPQPASFSCSWTSPFTWRIPD